MEIKHNDFTRLFQRYGFAVEQLGDNSYIASNETYFVPFSLDPIGCASAVSYLACDKEKFIEAWHKYNKTMRIPYPIGYYAWYLYGRGNKEFFHFGGVGNHDHSTWEIEYWLKSVYGKR